MAKKKKNKKSNWNQSVSRWAKDNQTLIALLGGVAGGALVTSAVRSEKGQRIFTDLSHSVKDLVPARIATPGPNRSNKGESASASAS